MNGIQTISISISVVFLLVGSFHVDADVAGLFWLEQCQLGVEMGQVKSCDLLVQDSWEFVDSCFVLVG